MARQRRIFHSVMSIAPHENLFEESVRDLLRFAAERLNMNFAIAWFDHALPIANDAAAPLEKEVPSALTTRLIDSQGRVRGTLSVIDDRAQSLTESSRQVLLTISRLLTRWLEMRDLVDRGHEDYFRVLTDNIADLILIVEADGTHKYISASIEKILGYKVEERLGRSALENVHPDDKESTKSLLQVLAGGGHIDRFQLRLRHKNGSWRLLDLQGTNLLDHARIRGIVLSASDITDRRRLEQELEQLNRLTSLGRLAAQVAHEFNNVMMGIQPAVDVLRRLGSGNAQIGRLTDLIAASIGRGKRITSDILRFGRPAQLTLRPVNIDELFIEAAREILPLLPRGIELALEGPHNPLHIRGDRQQLVQVLLNLAINARDAMASRGGKLTIGARPGSQHTAQSIAAIPNAEEFLHINVTDTGEGIPSENVPYIFEPLFTTKSTGTGLGLSVVYQVVTGHGGHIFVETKRDHGTTFHIFIPRALERGAEPQDKRPPQRPAGLSKLRVLLAEDDLNVATGLKWVLEAEGMSVHVVGEAAGVVPAVDEFNPDILVLDLSLPDGDGRVVFERVAGSLPVIVSTGSVGARDFAQSGHGGVPVLMKPYSADDLLRAIYEVLFLRGLQ